MPPRSRGSACARRHRPRHSRSSRQPHLEEQLWALARPRAAGQPAGALAVPRRSLSRCQPLREEAALLAAEGAAAMLAAPAYGLLSTWILLKKLEHPGVAGFSGLREHCQGEKGKASAQLGHRGCRRTDGRTERLPRTEARQHLWHTAGAELRAPEPTALLQSASRLLWQHLLCAKRATGRQLPGGTVAGAASGAPSEPGSVFPLGSASFCTASPSAPSERKRHSCTGSDRSSAGGCF